MRIVVEKALQLPLAVKCEYCESTLEIEKEEEVELWTHVSESEEEPDVPVFRIKCPVCNGKPDVSSILPLWWKRRKVGQSSMKDSFLMEDIK